MESGSSFVRTMSSTPTVNPSGGRSRPSNSPATKKCSRSRTMGPPTSKPANTLSSSPGSRRWPPISASPTSASLRKKPNADPPNSLDPVRVTALRTPPVNPDWRTSYGAVSTWSSSIAASGITRPLACPPATPVGDRPNTSWLRAPSTWMLLKRMFDPATDIPMSSDRHERRQTGESREVSREMVGSVFERLAVDDGRRAHAGGVEFRIRLDPDGEFGQGHRRLGELNLQPQPLSGDERQAFPSHRAEPDARHLQRVRPAGPEIGEAETAEIVAQDGVRGAGPGVAELDPRPGHRRAIGINHAPRDAGGRDSLSGDDGVGWAARPARRPINATPTRRLKMRFSFPMISPRPQ